MFRHALHGCAFIFAAVVPFGLTAQTTTSPPASQPPGSAASTAQYRSLDDMTVISSSGEEIGEVEDVLIDATGKVVAVAIDVDRFLGIGGDEVIVALDQLRLQDGKLVSSMTKDQAKALPKWND